MTLLTPEFLQDAAGTYSAQRLRYQQEMFTPSGEGVNGQADMRVSQRGAGVNMSVDIAAGDAIVRGDSQTRPGPLPHHNDAVVNAAITANASGNPRIDRVWLQLSDATDSGSGTDTSVFVVSPGTPTAAASLDNLNGAAAIPNNVLHLADVLVANGAASIADASIRSRRTFTKPIIPPLAGLTDVDQVPMMPAPGLVVGNSNAVFTTVLNNFQSAALHILPRRIVGATKLRWRYGQAATTAYTGNYIFAIYDASGAAGGRDGLDPPRRRDQHLADRERRADGDDHLRGGPVLRLLRERPGRRQRQRHHNRRYHR
jgi:hypothetical protein